MASAEQRASITGSGSPALASDGNDSFSSTASSDDHNESPVTCIVKPSISAAGKEYSGFSLEELRSAILKDKLLQVEDDGLPFSFVCGEDGREMSDVEDLRRYVKMGHNVMHLIHPNDPSAFRSINVDWSAKLYKELKGTEEGDVMVNMHDWVDNRLDDLEALFMTNPQRLALRLGALVTMTDIIKMQLGIHQILEELERGEYY